LRDVSSIPRTIKTGRDVLLFRLNKEHIMVVSCDSAGGIGPKPLDRVKVDGYTVGKFTARVALMETLSVGANPLCLMNTLAVEPRPTGIQIIKGIRGEIRYARLNSQIAMRESTEKNVLVRQTGVGVTVIGTATPRSLKIKRCRSSDNVFAVGLPHVGNEVLLGEKLGRIADTRDVRKLLNLDFVHEIIPVGSQGILREAQTIAEDSNLRFILRRGLAFDVRKSAGPATVVLCACHHSYLKQLSRFIEKPVNLIGKFG
jgi:hypothetical protein